MMRICIDPGHGGADPGAVANGLREKDLTLDIALKLRDYLLTGWQCEVKLTREIDKYLSLSDRCRIANDCEADLFYSVHCNGHANTEKNGWESFVHSATSEQTKQYQKAIHGSVFNYLKGWGTLDRGMKSANFQVLRETEMSAILGEYLFISGDIDSQILKNPEALNIMAVSTATGIAKALDLEQEPKGKASGPFPDVPSDHWAAGAISYVSDPEQLIMAGFGDGTFRPDESVTRAQLAVVVERVMRGTISEAIKVLKTK